MAFFPCLNVSSSSGGVSKIYNKTVFSADEHTLEKDCSVIYLCSPIGYSGYLSVNGNIQTVSSYEVPDNTTIAALYVMVYEGTFHAGDKVQFCSYKAASNWQNNGGSAIFY